MRRPNGKRLCLFPAAFTVVNNGNVNIVGSFSEARAAVIDSFLMRAFPRHYVPAQLFPSPSSSQRTTIAQSKKPRRSSKRYEKKIGNNEIDQQKPMTNVEEKDKLRQKTDKSKKRNYVSNGKDVLESWSALEGPSHANNIHTLILGTMPSDKSYGNRLSKKEIILRGGSEEQNYGASGNTFWNIVGSAFGFHRHILPYKEQVQILNDHGYSVWDVLKSCQRLGSLDSKIVDGSRVPNDLPSYILEHAKLNRFVFAANSATQFCSNECFDSWLETGTANTTTAIESGLNEEVKTTFWMQGEKLNPLSYRITKQKFGKKRYRVEIVNDKSKAELYQSNTVTSTTDTDSDCTTKKGRIIELIAMPSTSPAHSSQRPPEKEKIWHIGCYDRIDCASNARRAAELPQPPDHYECPGCVHYQKYHNKIAKPIEKLDRHWFEDCPYREDWKSFKRSEKQPKIVESYKDIDPYRWYL